MSAPCCEDEMKLENDVIENSNMHCYTRIALYVHRLVFNAQWYFATYDYKRMIMNMV